MATVELMDSDSFLLFAWGYWFVRVCPATDDESSSQFHLSSFTENKILRTISNRGRNRHTKRGRQISRKRSIKKLHALTGSAIVWIV